MRGRKRAPHAYLTHTRTWPARAAADPVRMSTALPEPELPPVLGGGGGRGGVVLGLGGALGGEGAEVDPPPAEAEEGDEVEHVGEEQEYERHQDPHRHLRAETT